MTHQTNPIRDFITIVVLSKTTTGEAVYEAHHPEFPTFLGQGASPELAISDLNEVTALAIEHFVAHGIPVPKPQHWTGRIVVNGASPQNERVQNSWRAPGPPAPEPMPRVR